MTTRTGKSVLLSAVLAGSVWIQSAAAHAPLMDCFIENNGVKCEAGYSDGTSAAGKRILVLDANHKVLLEGVLDQTGSFTFKPPAGDYHVIFEGGENHTVTLYSTDIS